MRPRMVRMDYCHSWQQRSYRWQFPASSQACQPSYSSWIAPVLMSLIPPHSGALHLAEKIAVLQQKWEFLVHCSIQHQHRWYSVVYYADKVSIYGVMCGFMEDYSIQTVQYYTSGGIIITYADLETLKDNIIHRLC